ncbi:hypothetical protein BV898_10251 [Hypsibius exemplaris]|uniref:Integrase catalytic domain-containing protein n=1 Tax=Hypsibius exemplaris TaxID=2072580 RepID=A0A1W0WKD8_HYPEX|nr:hypothetical protein BV898_10251 [Hypsibius exemplaris]
MEGLFVYAAGMPNIWKKVRLEILGPFTTTAEGHRYLVFAVDVHTYWMEGRSLAHSSPDLIARFIFSLFARFGRAEFSVVGQKADFCRQLAASLQALLRSQDSSYGMGPTNNSGVVHHGRHGAEQVYHLPDLGPDAGITTGGMALNPDGQLNCDQADDLPPEQANLFAHSDPVNPLPRHGSFTRVSRSLKQRSVNYTNLGSDLLNFVSANMEDWDAKLDGCLYHMRTAIAVCNKGYSAFHLAYGRNPAPITGRELMVRSLRGVKEVLNLFSLTGAEKKPTSQLSSQQSEPKEAAGSAPQSNVAKKLSTKRYNLRTGALPLSPVCRETESPLHDGPQHTSHPSISGPTDDIRLTGSGVCSTAQRSSTSIPAHSAAATTAETSSKAAAAAEKSSKKNIS